MTTTNDACARCGHKKALHFSRIRWRKVSGCSAWDCDCPGYTVIDPPEPERIEKVVCNQENGSFSELWGRNCWVADSMLKQIQAAFEPGEKWDTCEETHKLLNALFLYCVELRQKNKEPHFDDVVWTEERPL